MKLKRIVVFVGGVHGVGKTTICKAICEGLKLEYLSASDLIKWSEMNDDPYNKFVKDISDMQRRLVSALDNNVTAGKHYLLDGHFCLFNFEGTVTKVPMQTFELIKPSLLCVISGDASEIKEALQSRGSNDYKLKLINEMQSSEISYATETSSHLHVPLVQGSRTRIDKLIADLKKALYP